MGPPSRQGRPRFLLIFLKQRRRENPGLQAKNGRRVENIIASEKGILKNLTKEDVEVLFG